MSLGFLTESALLPSKAKKINNVDNSSLIDLKAVIYQKEQHLKHQATERIGLRKKRGREDVDRKRTSWEEKTNPGVEGRQIKDKLDHQRENKVKNAHTILKKKAEMYEKLAKGELGDGEGVFLVNFSQKSKGTATVETEESKYQLGEQHSEMKGPLIELADDLTTSSSLDLSNKHQAFMESEQQQSTVPQSKLRNEEWAWSRGEERSDTAEWCKNKNPGYDFTPSDAELMGGSKPLDGARVLSQWERKLSEKAKQHIKEIHQETKTSRTAAELRMKEKQQRRELLRQKQQQRFGLS